MYLVPFLFCFLRVVLPLPRLLLPVYIQIDYIYLPLSFQPSLGLFSITTDIILAPSPFFFLQFCSRILEQDQSMGVASCKVIQHPVPGVPRESSPSPLSSSIHSLRRKKDNLLRMLEYLTASQPPTGDTPF